MKTLLLILLISYPVKSHVQKAKSVPDAKVEQLAAFAEMPVNHFVKLANLCEANRKFAIRDATNRDVQPWEIKRHKEFIKNLKTRKEVTYPEIWADDPTTYGHLKYFAFTTLYIINKNECVAKIDCSPRNPTKIVILKGLDTTGFSDGDRLSNHDCWWISGTRRLSDGTTLTVMEAVDTTPVAEYNRLRFGEK